MRENPEKAMTLAVKGMLPDNTLGRKALTSACTSTRASSTTHAGSEARLRGLCNLRGGY